MPRKILAVTVIFVLISQNAFAAASSAHVTREAQRVIMTVNTRIDAAASSIVSALNSLLRDNKGMNVAQAVREFQATSSQDTANLAKQITAALDGHQANLIAYDQRKAALESAREAAARIPSAAPEDCALLEAKKGAAVASATRAAYSTAGGNAARKTAAGAGSPALDARELFEARKEDPKALDAGILTRPGCEAKIGDETAYAEGLPVVDGYECTAPNLTIPAEDAEKAAKFIARVVVPSPAPELSQEARKTPAGTMYEAERDKVRMRQSYLLDVAQDSGAQFQATRDMAGKKEFFEKMDVAVPDKISEMDYLRYNLISRWDNPKFQEFQKTRSETDILRDIHETMLLQARMQFRQLEIMERKLLAEMQFYEAVQDGPSRAKLQTLRANAGAGS